MRIQEHIINKVVLDVNTNSKKVGNELKNSIDTFLKEEVFPLLESFFESIATDNTIKRIPQLSLDIDLNARDFSLTSEISKKKLKKKISEQLQEIISQPEVHDIQIIESSKEKTKADTFFEFLESGALSWWNNPSNNFNFSKRDIFEITETSNFSFRFLKVLQTPSQKARLFNQFFDEELHLLFLGVSNKSVILNRIQEELSTPNLLMFNSETKKELWNSFSEAVVRKDSSIFFDFIMNTIYKEEDKENKELAKKLKEFLQTRIINKVEVLESLPNDILKKLEELRVIDLELKKGNKLDQKNQKSKDKIKDRQKEINLGFEDYQSVLSKEAEIDSEKKITEKHITEKNPIDLENTNIDNSSTSLDVLRDDQKVSPIENSVNHISNNTKEISNTDFNSNNENKNQNPEIRKEDSLNELSSKAEGEAKRMKNELHIEKGQDAELTIEKIKDEESNQVSSTQNSEGDNSYGIDDDKLKEEVQENIYSESYQNKKSKEIKQLKRNQEQDKLQKQNPSELKKIKELFKGFNTPKSYIIKNAGLILIHPFLKPFFASCNLLNDKNEIIKPTEAVHLLHYVATKKEKQLESNLIFEKFLCNVPIHQSIERNITLSDELKENAENLLQSIVQNWEILKNSSTDLIRNEFIQRQGKLDLTKDNPHITIERKTQDILLDKLPWNYSLCKLPWMKTLLFTDW